MAIFTAIARLRARFKSQVFSDLHRMASGISGFDLPQVSVEKGGRPLEMPLQFSLKRRQHLTWQRYICGGSH